MESTTKKPSRWPWPDSLDAVLAAPDSHRVLSENDRTRVLEVIIAPGEREPEHTHRWPSIMVVHQPARLRLLHRRHPGLHLTGAALARRVRPAGQVARARMAAFGGEH
jgi:hypothetical protein